MILITLFHLYPQDGRTPLDFLFVQDLASSHKLIQRLRFVDLEKEEPDPWKEKEEEELGDDDDDDAVDDEEGDDDSGGDGQDYPEERASSSCVIT